MVAGSGKAGDFAGDPLQIASPSLAWVDTAHTTLRASWTAASGAVYILYVNGSIIARNVLPPFDIVVPTPGTLPNIAAVAVASIFASDGTYDPIGSANVANLASISAQITLDAGIYTGPVQAIREVLAGLTSVQKLLQVSNTNDALLKLIAFGVNDDHPRPFVLVSLVETNRQTQSLGFFKPSGSMVVSIEIPMQWNGVSVSSVDTAYRLRIASLAGLPDDFLTGATLSDGTHSAPILAFVGATGECRLGQGFASALSVGASVTISFPDVGDSIRFFMRQVEAIQAEFENAIRSGPMNITGIRMGDYGRMLPDESSRVYGGAKLELNFTT